MKSATDRWRWFAALLLSVLLHASVTFALFGEGSAAGTSPSGVKKQQIVRPLRTRLTLEKYTAPTYSEQTETSGLKAGTPTPAVGTEEPPPPAGSVGLGLSQPITYFAADQLTKLPQAMGDAELDAPEIGANTASGTLILRLRISASGETLSVDAEDSDLPEVFSQSAVKAFRKLRFAPGEINGERVASTIRIEIRYSY